MILYPIYTLLSKTITPDCKSGGAIRILPALHVVRQFWIIEQMLAAH
jgi:hypothetical protein